MVAAPSPLRYPSTMPVYVNETERAQLALEHPANVLATVHFGAGPAPQRPAPWLEVRIPILPLSPGAAEEVWPAAGAVTRIDVEGASAAGDDRSVFVAIEARAASGLRIDALTFDVYRRLLRGVMRAGYPHMLRIWNYVPRIHDTSSGIDRYKLFCKGRSEAFAAQYGGAFSDQIGRAHV